MRAARPLPDKRRRLDRRWDAQYDPGTGYEAAGSSGLARLGPATPSRPPGSRRLLAHQAGRWAQMSTVGYPIEMVNGVPVVAAPEEIDISNADWLRAVLLEAAARGNATFVVDMTRTQFCGSSGVRVLVRAHKRTQAEGGELRLVIPASATVLRVFALTGLDQMIPNFADLDEALEVAPAVAARPPPRRRRPKPGMRPRADRPPLDPGAS